MVKKLIVAETISLGAFPVGKMYASIKGGKLRGMYMDTQVEISEPIKRAEDLSAADRPVYEKVLEWLKGYFNGDILSFDENLIELIGTEFQISVWKQLMSIPLGKCVSYGEIADALVKKSGKRTSARAVGGAVGANPISIIIPCHRVLGKDGRLTGYSGGIDKKRWLLKHEGFELEGDRVKL